MSYGFKGKHALFVFFLSLITLSSVGTTPVSAHLSGYPPFFKVDGEYPPPYPIATSRIAYTKLLIPQDKATKNYLINTPINFSINTDQLGTAIPPIILEETDYEWSFGDGERGNGLTNTHTYKKAGSYILTITASYNQPNVPPQLIESVMLNILPNKNYKLPQAVLKVEGKTIKDPLTQNISLDLNNKLLFDTRNSNAPSGYIKNTTLDFDDGGETSKNFVYHMYKLPNYFVSPILRVIDNNGFISDASVNIINIGSNNSNNIDSNNVQEPNFLERFFYWLKSLSINPLS